MFHSSVLELLVFNLMNNGNLNEITIVPPQRDGRRKATRGVFLDKMTKAMGRRMPISVAEGNLRPHEPVQAAKFASEAGVIVRSQVPTLTHWNQYMEQTEHFDGFMGRLSVSAYVLVVLHSTLFPMAVVQLGFYFWSPG